MPNTKISPLQLMVIIALGVMGDSTIVLLYIPAKEAMQDAWISGLISLFTGIILTFFFHSFHKRFPNETYIETSSKLFGKWIGGAVSASFLFYLIISMGAHVRELGIIIRTDILTDTPLLPLHTIFIAIVIMGVRMGLETIARTGEIIFPWIMLMTLLLFFMLIPASNGDNLLPMFEYGWKPVLRGSLTFIAFPFLELAFLFMLLPSVTGKSIKKWMVIGTLVGGLALFFMMFFCITVLGPEVTSRQVYPAYTLSKKVHIGNFLERIEVLIGFIWISTNFIKVTLYFYATSLGLAQLFKLSSPKITTYPVGMLVLALSLFVTPNVTHYQYIIEKYWPFFDATYGFLFPLIFILIGWIKGRKKETKRTELM
ncbi:GerAB/ArcD/ProY family transporter [Peribacillus acanthi]|uniref:GerAB/ArcD/ProY family transporter n=1 Tax=Peribacillus acanthi TaxID=2171554 RepID=UPI000D3E7E39|nr:endospore germination permease [Peribacillus acanthi]